MYRKFLRSKIHGIRVKEANVDYTGSITLDRDLIDAAGIGIFEMVMVINIDNGERFETYVIEAERGSGYVGLNGGAARKGKIGDRLIVFSSLWAEENTEHTVKLIIADQDNRVSRAIEEVIRI
ncbi:MAG: aspartate 1-decarboxylase [Elusimicrobiota bacterium]